MKEVKRWQVPASCGNLEYWLSVRTAVRILLLVHCLALVTYYRTSWRQLVLRVPAAQGASAFPEAVGHSRGQLASAGQPCPEYKGSPPLRTALLAWRLVAYSRHSEIDHVTKT